jgi:hypothetical protein
MGRCWYNGSPFSSSYSPISRIQEIQSFLHVHQQRTLWFHSRLGQDEKEHSVQPPMVYLYHPYITQRNHPHNGRYVLYISCLGTVLSRYGPECSGSNSLVVERLCHLMVFQGYWRFPLQHASFYLYRLLLLLL